MTVPSLNFNFLIKQKRKFKWVSLSFFSQTGTYSLTALVYELNKKKELHFDVDIKHEQNDDGNFTASLIFRADNPDASLNGTLCYLLENFSSARTWSEEYWHNPKHMKSWMQEKTAQYAGTPLTDKPLYSADLSKYSLAELKAMTKEQLENLK